MQRPATPNIPGLELSTSSFLLALCPHPPPTLWIKFQQQLTQLLPDSRDRLCTAYCKPNVPNACEGQGTNPHSPSVLPTNGTKLSQFKVETKGLWGSFQSLTEKILHFHSLGIREYEAGSVRIETASREMKVVGVLKYC